MNGCKSVASDAERMKREDGCFVWANQHRYGAL